MVPYAMPFLSQHFGPEEIRARGFDNILEGDAWLERSCGVVCLWMILHGLLSLSSDQAPSLAMLIRRGLDIDAYSDRGWVHRGLVALGKEWGVEGTAVRAGTIDDLTREVLAGRPCIVSINAGFEANASASGTPGGHLAVVLGIDIVEENTAALVVHHPSSWPHYNWPERAIGVKQFSQHFSGNYMTFGPRSEARHVSSQ